MLVNGHKADIASLLLKAGDTVTIKNRKESIELVKLNQQQHPQPIPDFLEITGSEPPEGRLIRVAAGHYDLAHREGCRTVDRMLAAEIDEPYDVVVASAGGFPLDIDLRQAHKGLENACQALRPGGSIVFYAECSNGAGHQAFEDYIRRFDDDLQMRKALEQEFQVGGHKAFWVTRLGRLYDVHLVSGMDPGFVRRCHYTPVPQEDHKTALDDVLARHGARARVAVIPYSGFTLPVKRKLAEVALQ